MGGTPVPEPRPEEPPAHAIDHLFDGAADPAADSPEAPEAPDIDLAAEETGVREVPKTTPHGRT